MKIYRPENKMPVLLNDDMSIITPVYKFVKMSVSEQKSDNTILAYLNDLKVFFTWLIGEDLDWTEVTADDLVDFLWYLQFDKPEGNVLAFNAKRTPKTINRMLSSLSAFYAYFEGYDIKKSPFQYHVRSGAYHGLLAHASSGQYKQAKLRIKNQAKEIQLLSDEDASTIEEELNNKYGKKHLLAFRIMRFTGCRASEVIGLKISQIPNPNNDVIMPIRNVKGKGNKYRNLYAPTFLINEINSYILDERGMIDTDCEELFVSESNNNYGKPMGYTGFQKVLKEITEAYNINATYHTLRHTYCTGLIKSGMPIAIVKEIMGHANISTTMLYTHLDNSDIMKELQEYWSGKNLDIEGNL